MNTVNASRNACSLSLDRLRPLSPILWPPQTIILGKRSLQQAADRMEIEMSSHLEPSLSELFLNPSSVCATRGVQRYQIF